ncbi:hypothetical protein ETAA8_39340 [Anatilimnocola aggregata]|uniref:Uncharacterized protein n=1 Tax=Anatilimnocola aggregata TaxID=2528021 RepID=A0A517YF30_9BACT|nr:hypothetical protein [Anatilimnocola aggregata]QDU28829.1 hypothetical protein ETAA8_39340 [Anatilimnocola aggregata]
MPVTVTRTSLQVQNWNGSINKATDIVGMNGVGLNIELEAHASGGDELPPSIKVQLEFKEASQAGTGKASWSGKPVLDVPRHAYTSYYRFDVPWQIWSMLGVAEGRREFATVVRYSSDDMKATADGAFRSQLVYGNWADRGMAQQSLRMSNNSGDARLRRPDAKQLMLAGGVEILEIKVLPQPHLKVKDGSTYCFMRSPADVFFYTGHGLGGNLVTHGGPGEGLHDDFMTPEELLQAWTVTNPILGPKSLDVDVLIINGCSVLNCDDKDGTGKKWARLLMNQEGPLYSILGYRDGAPADSNGGHAVAAAMGKAIIGNLDSKWMAYAKTWLEINKQNHKHYRPTSSNYSLANACAIDLNGYWYLEELDDELHIIGPKKLPK